MNSQKLIVLGGGGSAGHVSPLLALAERLPRDAWRVHYVGSKQGLEVDLPARAGIDYSAIAAGKLSRGRMLANLRTPGAVLAGIRDANRILSVLRPSAVVASGGYVSFPLVVAAWSRRIPCVLYESDITPGLATRAGLPFARRVLCAFEAALEHLPPGALHTGPLLRERVRRAAALRDHVRDAGNADASDDPNLVVFGGSLGSRVLNDVVRRSLPALTRKLRVIHVCGRGNLDPALQAHPGYAQFEYRHDLPETLARASVVLARAGANSLWELVALRVPHIVVPLSQKVSRGDQIQNARFFERRGASCVVPEESLSPQTLLAVIDQVQANRERYLYAMRSFDCDERPLELTLGVLEQLCG